jgi:hypothetical protein
MRNFSKILAFAAISAASTVAYAGGDPYHHNHMMADGGFVFGIDGGYGYLSTPEAAYPNNFINEETYKYTSSVDAGDYVWGVHVGYDFRIKPGCIMGLELGYKDLGSTSQKIAYQELGEDTYYSDASRDYKQNAVDMLITANHYIYKGLNVFGKVGAAYVRSDIDQHATSDTSNPFLAEIPITAYEGDNSIWRIQPEFSFGVGYMFSNHVDVHASYTYIGGANDQPLVDVGTDVNGYSTDTAYYPKARVYSTNMLMVGLSYTF